LAKEIKMNSARFGSVVLLASLVLGGSAQELKKDLGKVGTETKKATKDTGHVIAKDSKTATDKTVDGTKKVYHKTADGTEKVADKTAEGTKKAYHKTADGTEKVADLAKGSLRSPLRLCDLFDGSVRRPEQPHGQGDNGNPEKVRS
jgi:hypothetical protein